MIKVGITGGIGSGKTTVCRVFESMGVRVYYADQEAKRLMSYDPVLKSKIKDLLGANAYHRNGRLNRTYVASIVFNDPGKLEALNGLVHPAVGKDVQAWFDQIDSHWPYALQEAALLVENGSYKRLDALISVSAPLEERIQRVMKRDNVNRSAVEARIKNQLPQEEKDAVADYVIYNFGTHSLIQQVVQIHRALLERAK
jgi:dephospho-CoA kinase